MFDPFNLQRFADAQQHVFEDVLDELHAGRKRSHWMWFIFPQLAGLGRSAAALRFGIRSLEEAEAYFAHDLLGPRLIQCTKLMLVHRGRSAEAILGPIDAMKFRSSMTLFEVAAGDPEHFAAAIDLHFRKQRDPLTLELLTRSC